MKTSDVLELFLNRVNLREMEKGKWRITNMRPCWYLFSMGFSVVVDVVAVSIEEQCMVKLSMLLRE